MKGGDDSSPADCSRPRFSIVVPTFDRPEPLASLLDALARLDYPESHCEVVVVDDGSAVPAETGLSAFRERLSLNVVRQDNGGPAAARNRGAECANGDYLAFVDDDCLPDADWLTAMGTALRESPDSLCGGRMSNALPDSLCATAHQFLLDFLFEHYNPALLDRAFYPSANMAMRREDFLELGGFDATLRFGEDREFCHRWGRSGRPFASVPASVVHHAHALALPSLLKLHLRYGGGTFHYWQRVDWDNAPHGRIGSPLFYVKLVSSGVLRERSFRGLLLSALLAATQAAAAVGLVWQAMTSSRKT